MLSHLGNNKSVSLCLPVNLLNHIRSCQSFLRIGKRIFFLVFLNLCNPFRMFKLPQLLIYFGEGHLQIAYDPFMNEHILIHLSRIYVELQDFGAACKFLRIAGNSVAESGSQHNQQVAFTDAVICRLGSVHAQHACIQLISSGKCSFSHQGIGNRSICLLYKFINLLRRS